MIAANNVTLRIGKKALFEDVNIKFTEGNCYGLIGANGAGKSTFLKILSGQLETTKGDITITPGQRLSFLQQDHFKYDAYPVLDTVISRMVSVLRLPGIEREDVVIIEGCQYRIAQVQEKFDASPPCLYLSLESVQMPYRDEREGSFGEKD